MCVRRVQVTAWQSTVPSDTSIAQQAQALSTLLARRPDELAGAAVSTAVSFIAQLSSQLPYDGTSTPSSAATFLGLLGTLTGTAMAQNATGGVSHSRRMAVVDNGTSLVEYVKEAVSTLSINLLAGATTNEAPTVVQVWWSWTWWGS